GVVRDGEVLNDPSLELLARTAVSQAEAGADVVAPSAMMDGQVGAIREALDEAGFQQIAIMSYAVKYASAFYGPFREAAESTPAFGDRRSYQMDAANAREALREALLDVEEGADLVMVKPAGPYLDVIRRVRDAVRVPVVAYQVSGEFSLIKAAAARGWIDERAAALETLTGIRRAGADLIIAISRRRWRGGCAHECRCAERRRGGGSAGISRRLPPSGGPASTHLDHAAGGALPARISGAARPGRQIGADAHTRARRRSDAPTAAPLRARCRDPLQRHHDAAPG